MVLGVISKALGHIGKKEEIIMAPTVMDPTAWMVESEVSKFLLFETKAIKYMCMFGYAYMAGACHQTGTFNSVSKLIAQLAYRLLFHRQQGLFFCPTKLFSLLQICEQCFGYSRRGNFGAYFHQQYTCTIGTGCLHCSDNCSFCPPSLFPSFARSRSAIKHCQGR